jgi:hypothetical protein
LEDAPQLAGFFTDNISYAKYAIGSEQLDPYGLSLRMKNYIHLSIAGYPVEAFLGMKTDQDSRD